jgi:arylsulfatase A-like enzyme
LSDWDEPTLRESIAQTYGMITHVDDSIGRVLDHLHRAGLADNTIVVFTSDHGDYLGAHHLLLKWRYPYEQLVRVPFIWHAPGGMSQSCRSDIVSHLEFVPTVLDYAGISQGVLDRRGSRKSDPLGLPGRSLRRAIDEGTPLDECDALVEFDQDYSPGPMCRYRMLIHARYKLCVYGGTRQGILYDLQEDPCERRNLWDDSGYAKVKCDLLAALADRLAVTDRFDGVRYCSA